MADSIITRAIKNKNKKKKQKKKNKKNNVNLLYTKIRYIDTIIRYYDYLTGTKPSLKRWPIIRNCKKKLLLIITETYVLYIHWGDSNKYPKYVLWGNKNRTRPFLGIILLIQDSLQQQIHLITYLERNAVIVRRIHLHLKSCNIDSRNQGLKYISKVLSERNC